MCCFPLDLINFMHFYTLYISASYINMLPRSQDVSGLECIPLFIHFACNFTTYYAGVKKQLTIQA